jgi:catechol 2,3-dioxygenase-like lactoylglutathione lyase family enzyme
MIFAGPDSHRFRACDVGRLSCSRPSVWGITISTPDLARQLSYYSNIVGLSIVDQTPDRAILASKSGLEAVVLERGAAPSCSSIALQVSTSIELKDIASKLDHFGIKRDIRSDLTPGVARAIVFEDPKGTRVELFNTYSFAPDDGLQAGIMPLKLGHVAFTATDVQKLVDFYSTVLGFRVSDWRGDFFAFMRCGPDHHSVNFLKGDANTVHHVAFELRDWAEIQRAVDYLAKKDIRLVLGPIRHIIGHNIATYHRNSDELLIEFFTEIDQMKDEDLGYFDPRPWHQDRPQRPKVWDLHTLSNYWGPGRLASRDDDKSSGK